MKAGARAGAEAAASACGVAGPRQRFVVLHGEKRPAGLALRILDDPLDAELIGEFAAQIHEAHAHVVAFDEGLDQRAVAIALPDASRPVVRLQPVAAQAVGENADLRAERVGLDEQRNVRPRPVAEGGDFRIPFHEPGRGHGKAGGGGEREACELVLGEVRRGGRAAEAREAREASESGNRGAAIETHAIGERPYDRPLAPRRQFSQPRREVVEGDEFGGDSLLAQGLRDLVDEQRQVSRLGEIDGDLGGDVGGIAERFEPAARRILALEGDHRVGQRGSAFAQGRSRRPVHRVDIHRDRVGPRLERDKIDYLGART